MSATVGRPVAVGSVPSYAQGDPRWGSLPVGEGREPFASVGCMVTSLAAAAGTLGTSALAPPAANDAIRRAGGFSGTSLRLPTAAAALGLRAPDSERIRAGGASVESLRARLDSTLDRGGVALVHVDYDTTSAAANHFVLCFGRDVTGGYLCHDVAGAASKVILLSAGALDVQRTASRRYTAAGVAPLWRADDAVAAVRGTAGDAAVAVGGKNNLMLLGVVALGAWLLLR